MPDSTNDELRSKVALIMSRSIVDGHFSCTEEECHQEDGSPINQVMSLIHQHTEQAKKYQVYIYKQDHPRLEQEGAEIWGIRIAYQGQQIYGDIAGSKDAAEAKLQTKLAQLTTNHKGGYIKND